MRKFKMAFAALLMAVMAAVGLAGPASAGDSGWQLQTFNDGSSSYTSCQAYQRAYDTPFGHTIGQIHGWTNCDMYGGTEFVQVDAAGQSTRWYSFGGHYNSGSQTWDFVTSFNGSYCLGVTVQIHGSANRVNC